MSLDVYSNYKVNIKEKYSVKIGKDEFEEHENEFTTKCDIIVLLRMIKQDLCNEDMIGVDIKDNKIYIEHFDSLTGEGKDIIYTIQRLNSKGE